MPVQITQELLLHVPDIVDKTIKELKMADHIGKRHWPYMAEINFAPPGPLPESQMKKTVIHITWPDGSTGFYQVVDIIRLDLFDLKSICTLASHGMEDFEFVKMWLEMHSGCDKYTKMAVYFYRKILPVANKAN
jgi:hypothetical protein